MNQSELNEIERDLGFALPVSYKRYMLDYPATLLDAKPADWKPITEWEFCNVPRRIIEINKFARAQDDGYFIEPGVWPDEYFIIGEEEAGNYYAINRISNDETVYMFHHEDGEILPTHTKSLDEFHDWMIEYFAQFK